MRFIETAELSGLDQTGLGWLQSVLPSFQIITINNNFYLFVHEQNFTSYFSHIILFGPTKSMCGTKVSAIVSGPCL